MREDSHLDDMRAAIRGDFERLAKRRGTQELMQEPVAEPESEPPGTVEPEAHEGLGVRPHGSDPTAEPEKAVEPEIEPEAERIPEPEPEPDPDPESVAMPELQEERRRAPAPPPALEPVPPVEGEMDDAAAEAAIEEPPRRGFFARLLGL